MEKIRIIVATHKNYEMPEDEIYIPLHVGSEGKTDAQGNLLELGYIKDNTNDNISFKNASYCELTGLYWMWKNIDADYLGLVHYRRHFKGKGIGKSFNNIISGEQLKKVFKQVDIVLPKKRHYFIETNKNQYLHAHHKEGYEETEKVIKENYPEYLSSFYLVMNKRSGHRFNMFVMKKSLFDDYCNWLFGILFEVEKRIDIKNWDASEQRVYGYISERLLDVWLDKNKIIYKEIPVMFMEKQNWIKKGYRFVKRKMIH